MKETRLTAAQVASEMGNPDLTPVLERILRSHAPESAQIVQEGYYVRSESTRNVDPFTERQMQAGINILNRHNQEKNR